MLTGIVFECVLLSRHAVRRAPRPQHSVLEVACQYLMSLPCLRRRAFRLSCYRSYLFAITVAMHWIMLLVSSAVLMVSGQVWRAVDEVVVFSRCRCCCFTTLSQLTPFGLRQFIAGCCSCPDGRAARHFYGPSYRCSPLAASRRLRSTLRISPHGGLRIVGDAPAIVATVQICSLPTPMTHITPGLFLTSPGLWIGLALLRHSSPQRFGCAAIKVRSDSSTICFRRNC